MYSCDDKIVIRVADVFFGKANSLIDTATATSCWDDEYIFAISYLIDIPTQTNSIYTFNTGAATY